MKEYSLINHKNLTARQVSTETIRIDTTEPVFSSARS